MIPTSVAVSIFCWKLLVLKLNRFLVVSIIRKFVFVSGDLSTQCGNEKKRKIMGMVLLPAAMVFTCETILDGIHFMDMD